MISKLRKKIIAINVVSVCIVFAVAMVLVFSTGYARINDERIIRLNGIVEQESLRDLEISKLKGVVVVEYDEDNANTLWTTTGEDVRLSDEQIESVVKKVVSKEKNEGWASVRVLYAKRSVDGVTRVALYDRHSNMRGVLLYMIYTLIALVVGSISYLVISYVLARVALAPVEESWNKQKQFLADASHELKTPLSVIMANTEIIASHGDETVESQKKWIENTRLESERMADLINDLLFLAKNDDGLKAQMDKVNISECVETIVLSHESVLYENGKIFNYSITSDLIVFGNDGQLKQLVAILLDNANKYSIGAGNILLEVENVGKNVHISVSNDCEELTEEQLEHLFDRFYTVDESRNKSNAGNGLGLSIAQVITHTHRGKITAECHNGRITFTVSIPLLKTK
ncbi:MAG: HAMP domain-containing histidine kinase [Clostridiales bacterium]|nr:HAMP domain-containing histidine kinase [Clostridiales bacterium]